VQAQISDTSTRWKAASQRPQVDRRPQGGVSKRRGPRARRVCERLPVRLTAFATCPPSSSPSVWLTVTT
jgi:hypothetical protein